MCELLEQLTVEGRTVLRERGDDGLVEPLLELALFHGVVVEKRTELTDDLSMDLEVNFGRQPVSLWWRRGRRRGTQRRGVVVHLDGDGLLGEDGAGAVLLGGVEDALSEQAHGF